MKRWVVFVAEIFVGAVLPAVFMGPNVAADPTEPILVTPIISEVYAGSQNNYYLELYFESAMPGEQLASYFIMSSTSLTGTLSRVQLLAGADLADDSYLVLPHSTITGVITNPAAVRYVWLCKGNAETLANRNACRAEGYDDLVQYGTSVGATYSLSRDISKDQEGEVPVLTKSKMTPGAMNDFSTEIINPPIVDPPELGPQYCDRLLLSEISTNEQWIELYNSSNLTITTDNLVDCFLSVQYGDKLPPNFDRYKLDLEQFLGAGVIAPYGYYVVDVSIADGLSLPKSVKDRMVIIFDAEEDYDEVKYSNQKANVSLAYFANGWKITYAPTPGSENIYQQWQTCDTGKQINEKTGNCVKIPEPPAECADGQYRNPATGRCKKIDGGNTLVDCAEGQFRNPLTNRCKKIASDDELAPCAEGWERNPETNRCRKIVNKGDAEYGIDPTAGSAMSDMWAWMGGGGLALAGGLVTWQFRPEISRIGRRITEFFGVGRK
jgi:hypothetical protein